MTQPYGAGQNPETSCIPCTSGNEECRIKLDQLLLETLQQR